MHRQMKPAHWRRAPTVTCGMPPSEWLGAALVVFGFPLVLLGIALVTP